MRTVFGLEYLTPDGCWSAGDGGHTRGNCFATRAEAEAALPPLAELMGFDVATLRVVQTETR